MHLDAPASYFEPLAFVLTAVGAVSSTPLLYGLCKRHFLDRHFHQLLPLRGRSDLLIVCPTHMGASGINPLTSRDDMLACATIVAFLERHCIPYEIKTADQVTAQDRKRDMILICGPKGNSITAELFEKMPSPFQFHRAEGRGFRIVDIEGRDTHPAPDAVRDFAILGKYRSLWTTQTRYLFVVAGIKGLGTHGAAQMFANQATTILRNIPCWTRRTSTGFSAVVQCTGDTRGMPVSATIVQFATT